MSDGGKEVVGVSEQSGPLVGVIRGDKLSKALEQVRSNGEESVTETIVLELFFAEPPDLGPLLECSEDVVQIAVEHFFEVVPKNTRQ